MGQITCGRCTKDAQEVVKHPTVADVRACYAAPQSYVEADWQAEWVAEAEAERRAERYWEEGTASQQAYRAWEQEQEERALGLTF